MTKNLIFLLWIICVFFKTSLQAVQILPTNAPTYPFSQSSLSAVSCSATCVVENTNNLHCSNDITWNGLVTSVLKENQQSTQATLSIQLSNENAHLITQKVVVFGATARDVSADGTQFLLHSENNHTIPFDLHVIYSPENLKLSKNTIIKPGEAMMVISHQDLISSDLNQDLAKNIFYGNIQANTLIIADTYSCSFVFKNYLEN